MSYIRVQFEQWKPQLHMYSDVSIYIGMYTYIFALYTRRMSVSYCAGRSPLVYNIHTTISGFDDPLVAAPI